MKHWVVLLAAALLAVCAIAASAAVYPTFEGATGVVTLPTAEVAPPGSINLALSYADASDDWKVALARVNGAVGQNLELWVGEVFWRNPFAQNIHFINGGLKYRLLSQKNSGIDVAIGGSLGRQESADGHLDLTKAFLAVSKDLDIGVPARLTAGALYGRFKGEKWDGNFTRPYAALELLDVKGCDFGVEYRWRANNADDTEAPFSAVVRYTVPDHPLWIEIGTTNAWEILGCSWNSQRGFFGIGYAFGGE